MDVKGVKSKSVTGELIKKISPLIRTAADAIIGFLLARGLIFGTWAPFGVAYAAASSTFGVIGAILGYISILNKANGLKYTAICVLVYTAAYVFRGTEIAEKRWFMPIAATVSALAIGFVFVIDSGFIPSYIIFYLTELCMVALLSYSYQIYFKSKQTALRRVSAVIIITTLTVPLSTFGAFGISLGRLIASLIIVSVGYFGGTGHGSVAAATLSIAIGATGDIYYGATYCLCGLVAPVFRKKGKYLYAASYFMLSIVGVFWTTMQLKMEIIYEAALACALFLPIEQFYAPQIKEFLFDGERDVRNVSKKTMYLAQERIEKVAAALRELGDMFRQKRELNMGSISSVFNSPAERICKKCLLSNSCWEREYVTTRDALNHATCAMQEKGRLEASDFPVHFSSRCIKIDEFIAETNQELAKFLYRKQCAVRINESRNLIKTQYGEMSKLFDKISQDMDFSVDLRAENKLAELLEQMEAQACPFIYRDSKNHLHIEIEGENLEALCNAEFSQRASVVLELPLKEPYFKEDGLGRKLILRCREPLRATLGAAVNKKRGTDISGDAGSYFRTEDGQLSVILADGMGSGREAALVSTTAIKMLERFTNAGIAPQNAISVINSALVLKGEENSGFTTLDFMNIDLFTGQCEIYKLGSAPSYIKRGRKVWRVCATTLPAGVPTPKTQVADRYCERLRVNDFVIFATDGVADGSDDMWICEKIANYEGESARLLATEILAAAAEKYGRADDMTVLVARVDKNE